MSKEEYCPYCKQVKSSDVFSPGRRCSQCWDETLLPRAKHLKRGGGTVIDELEFVYGLWRWNMQQLEESIDSIVDDAVESALVSMKSALVSMDTDA